MKNWKTWSAGLVIALALTGCADGAGKLTADDFSSSNYLKSPAAAMSILSANKDAGLQILDVRTPEEFKAECIDGSKNIDIEGTNFDSQIGQLNKTANYFVYCRSGRRSAMAVGKMRQAGFTNIIELQGGINAWKEAGGSIKTNCQ